MIVCKFLTKPRHILILLLAMLLSGCASRAPQSTSIESSSVSIGPYSSFHGRLIVIEPKRRWQVLIHWQADQPEAGLLRLDHAATGTVVYFRWAGGNMEFRGSQAPSWQPVQAEQLAQQGIVIAPAQLASILLGNMPAHFQRKNVETWESTASGSMIRLRWQAERHRLTMTDMKHGRIATLIIQPDQTPQ